MEKESYYGQKNSKRYQYKFYEIGMDESIVDSYGTDRALYDNSIGEEIKELKDALTKQLLACCKGKLTKRQEELLILYYVEGLNQSQIARKLGIIQPGVNLQLYGVHSYYYAKLPIKRRKFDHWKSLTPKDLAKLTPLQLEIVTRYYRDGQSMQQIGDAMGVTRECIRQRLYVLPVFKSLWNYSGPEKVKVRSKHKVGGLIRKIQRLAKEDKTIQALLEELAKMRDTNY